MKKKFGQGGKKLNTTLSFSELHNFHFYTMLMDKVMANTYNLNRADSRDLVGGGEINNF